MDGVANTVRFTSVPAPSAPPYPRNGGPAYPSGPAEPFAAWGGAADATADAVTVRTASVTPEMAEAGRPETAETVRLYLGPFQSEPVGPALLGPVPVTTAAKRNVRSTTAEWPQQMRPGANARGSAADRRRGWEDTYLRVLLLTDLAAGLLAGVAAFAVRFSHGVAPWNRPYLTLSALLPVAFVLSLLAMRAYEKRYLFVGTDEFERVIRAGLLLTAGTALVSYGLEIRLSRGYVVIALPLVTLLCLLGRLAVRRRLHRLRARGACMRQVILVGHDFAVINLTRQLRRQRYHGLSVVGACLPPPGQQGGPDPARPHDLMGVKVLGTFDDVAEAVARSRADTVVVLSCPELDGHALRRLAWRLERDDIDLIMASALVDVAGSRTTIRPVDGLPMLHVEHATLSGPRRHVKTAFDVCAAGLGLLLTAPVGLALALWVRLDSPGPVLFKQIRVGKDGREFLMYKFRTMYVDAEQRLAEIKHLNENDGVLFKMRNDPRVTRAGRVLRKYSLDELPQLLNVLKGDMSLVGPRPPLPREVALYPDDVRRRLAVKPGLTGLWQVSGRSDLPWEEAVRLDLGYVENWSLTVDLVILLRTLSAVSRGSGAY